MIVFFKFILTLIGVFGVMSCFLWPTQYMVMTMLASSTLLVTIHSNLAVKIVFYPLDMYEKKKREPKQRSR